jgi:hypothetical protein
MGVHSERELENRPGLRAESLSSLEPPSKQSYRASQAQSMMNLRASDYQNTLEAESQ